MRKNGYFVQRVPGQVECVTLIQALTADQWEDARDPVYFTVELIQLSQFGQVLARAYAFQVRNATVRQNKEVNYAFMGRPSSVCAIDIKLCCCLKFLRVKVLAKLLTISTQRCKSAESGVPGRARPVLRELGE
jgi:hypothetical protein